MPPPPPPPLLLLRLLLCEPICWEVAGLASLRHLRLDLRAVEEAEVEEVAVWQRFQTEGWVVVWFGYSVFFLDP